MVVKTPATTVHDTGGHRSRTPPAPPKPTPKSRTAGPQGASVPSGLGSAIGGSAGIREGLVVAPLAGGPVRTFGTVTAPHAWSTIKPAIAVAVARDHSLTADEVAQIQAAIANSDNEAADALFAALGSPTEANDAIDAVLERSGGTTKVNRLKTRPEFSTFGQTEWPLGEAARFYRALANGCLADPASTKVILDAMGSVSPAGGASWGLVPAGFEGVRFKDGLGPESGLDDYTAEQYGIVGGAETGGFAIGVVAQTDGTAGEAEAAVTDLATRAAKALRGQRLPRGRPSCVA